MHSFPRCSSLSPHKYIRKLIYYYFYLFFNRLGGPCTHKKASVQWMENQVARGPSLSSWWMRWGTSTRGPTPALPRTCKEPNQCPQMLKCFPSLNSRNHHQSDSEKEYGGLVECCVTVCCALLHNKIKCFLLETCYKLFLYILNYTVKMKCSEINRGSNNRVVITWENTHFFLQLFNSIVV